MGATADKLLIVNADDFGITEGATDAIIACHRAGAVTSTTFMSTMPAAAYAAAEAHSNPGLCVGLHFNLTLGEPLTRARGLLQPDGQLPDRGQLARAVLTGRIRASDIGAELQAQYLAMRALGLQPTHLDSHQHVHVIPGVFGEVARFAATNGLPLRMPWRWAGRTSGKTLKRRLKEGVLATTLSMLDRRRPNTVPTNNGFCSVFDLPIAADHLTVESYRVLLAPYRSGVIELMVHPAHIDEELMQKTAITSTSDTEAHLLTDPAFMALVKELGVELGGFGDIGGAK